jgi:hypothetical protein
MAGREQSDEEFTFPEPPEGLVNTDGPSPPPSACRHPNQAARSRPRRSRRRSDDEKSGGLTGEQRMLRARLAAYNLHARTTRRRPPARREVFLSRFEREVDPDGLLTAGERARRAEAARRAYFTRLAFQSSRARRRAGLTA